MKDRVIDRIVNGEGFTMDEIVEAASKENKIHLKNMNGFEQHFFKIGFYEGIRFAIRILEEVQAIRK